LFLSLLSILCGIFRDEQGLFILKASRISQLLLPFSLSFLHHLSQSSLKDLWSEQNLLCAEIESSQKEKKERYLESSKALKNIC
jgi:hypothetical protein